MSTDKVQGLQNLKVFVEGALFSHLQQSSSNDHENNFDEESNEGTNFISTSTTYLELLATIRNISNPTEIKRLCNVLLGYLSTIAMHPNCFQDVVKALLSVDWISCHKGESKENPNTVATCYVSMLSHLVSQNSCFLPPCFQMLVRNLFSEEDQLENNSGKNYRLQSTKESLQENASTSSNNDYKSKKNHLYNFQSQFIHGTIDEMLRIAPLYAGALMQVVEDNAPHSRLSRKTQKMFVQHSLHMTTYVPSLMYRILVVVVDRMIAIDVAIKLEDVVKEHRAQEREERMKEFNDLVGSEDDEDGEGNIGEENIVGKKDEEEDQKMFEMEDEVDEEEENNIRSRILSQDSKERAHMINEMAGKLDVMMNSFFNYLKKYMEQPLSVVMINDEMTEELQQQQAQQQQLQLLQQRQQLFELVLRVFEDTILNTYRSKYVQFLIFFICQYNSSFVELYVSRILGRMLHPQSPIITQRACAAYVASFLSRAKYVKPMAVVTSLHHMVTW